MGDPLVEWCLSSVTLTAVEYETQNIDEHLLTVQVFGSFIEF